MHRRFSAKAAGQPGCVHLNGVVCLRRWRVSSHLLGKDSEQYSHWYLWVGGDETSGGPSNAERISAFKLALERIEDRLQMITNREAA